MYSLDLLSKNGLSKDGKQTITGAQEVYEKFLDGMPGGVLYIKPDGSVLANPNPKNKPSCYVLALG